jgi:hypothetical protein
VSRPSRLLKIQAQLIRILNSPTATLSLGIALILLSLTSVHALDGAGTVNATIDSGWSAYEVVTSGDSISSVDAPGYGTTMTRTIFDGLGAYVTGNTLRVYLNHETTPGSISRVDLNLPNFQQSVTDTLANVSPPFAGVVSQIGLAYDAIYDGAGSLVASGFAEVDTYGNNNFARFCSGGVHLPDAFGPGMGFVDALYMTGEEVSGGKAYALDCATSELWEISAFGSHPWENFAPIDTGNTTHTAMAIWADSGGGDLMRVYVGEKNPSGDFLARNGLRGGTVYYFDGSTNGTLTLTECTEDFVFTTDTNDAKSVTKLEDIHTNPGNGKQLVFGAQNDGLYIMDVDIQFDGSGNVVTGIGGSTVSVSQALDDNNAISTFDDPDNVTWSPSGYIYVQEDGGSPGDEIWRLLPSDPIGTLTRVGQGNAETSGIIDVSAMAGFPHNTVYLFSIQGGSGMAQLVTLVNIAITEPSAFDVWAAESVLIGSDRTFNGDGDGDGDTNGYEYSVGANGGVSDTDSDRKLSLTPKSGGAMMDVEFGFLPGNTDLIWIVGRNNDLGQFSEIYRRDNGLETLGADVESMINPVDSSKLIVTDKNPGIRSFYQLQLVLKDAP